MSPAAGKLRIGVIGSGVMGGGIAQATAAAGHETLCMDVSQAALDQARKATLEDRFGLAGAVARGKLTSDEADAARGRLSFTTRLEEAAASDLVIECVPERLEAKIRVFRDLDRLAGPDAILASNTSGFPICALAAATDRPARVIGWHWASPAFVMKFAEIVTTAETDPTVTETVVAVASACGKNPIVVKDSPQSWGFVANRIYFAMIREAQRVVGEGVASRAEVNQLMVDCFRWPVGPFAMVRGATSGWKKSDT